MNVKNKLINYLATSTNSYTARQLSTELKYTYETIKSALNELVKEGKLAVQVKRLQTNGGNQLTNFYKIK